jgi:hypothetical protein
LCLFLAKRILTQEAIELDDKDDFEFASTTAAIGAVVTPELLSEEDKYVVVPDEWEASEEEEPEASEADGNDPEKKMSRDSQTSAEPA